MSGRPRYAVECPTCGAQPDEHCHTTTGTNRVTDTHCARIDAAWKATL